MKRIQKKWLMVLIAIAMMVSLVTVVGAADPEIEANYGFIPNSGEASVSKVDLAKNATVARYWTAPRIDDFLDAEGNVADKPFGIDPYDWRTARITMHEGNAWVINTGADGYTTSGKKYGFDLQGTIVRIQGDADPDDMNTNADHASPFTFYTDEAVQVFYVGGPGDIPRCAVFDEDGYLWVGFHMAHKKYGYFMKYEYDGDALNPAGGPYFGVVDDNAPQWDIAPYEAKIDKNGIIWFASYGSSHLRRNPGNSYGANNGMYSFDTNSPVGSLVRYDGIAAGYGILIDNGKSDDLVKVYATTLESPHDLWMKDGPEAGSFTAVATPVEGASGLRGMSFDNDGIIWIASSGNGGVCYYDPSTKASGFYGGFGTTPVGVGRDANGIMWVVVRGNNLIRGFDPANPAGPKTDINVGIRPYAYGDFIVIAPPVEELTVTKTAVTSYARTHQWDIDKWVKTEKGYTIGEDIPKIWLYTNGSGDETATWTVNVTYKGYEDSDWNVSGTIEIVNTGEVDAVITGIVDVLAGTQITVDCGEGVEFPITLKVNEILVCEYGVMVGGKVEGLNEVTVTTERNNTYSAKRAIEWGDPAEEFKGIINIEDVSYLFGKQEFGPVTAPNDAQFNYTKDFAWADYGSNGYGSYIYKNTATIVETEQSADATLKVNVQRGETAWAANGTKPLELRYTDRGNWATYVEYDEEGKKTTLFAGQTIPVGTVVFSACDGEEVTITVTLADGWEFEGVDENVKVQDYEFAPSGNPAPGLFAHKFTVNSENKSFEFTVPFNNFYGVHVNVVKWIV